MKIKLFFQVIFMIGVLWSSLIITENVFISIFAMGVASILYAWIVK